MPRGGNGVAELSLRPCRPFMMHDDETSVFSCPVIVMATRLSCTIQSFFCRAERDYPQHQRAIAHNRVRGGNFDCEMLSRVAASSDDGDAVRSTRSPSA